MERLFCRHTRELERSHQAVHSFDADIDAIITLQNIGDFICTKTFVIIGINLKNQSGDLLIFFGADSGFRMIMFIIRTSVDIQHFAKKLDAMLET